MPSTHTNDHSSVVASLAFALAILLPSSCFSGMTDQPVAIQCVDADDNPVQGAEVHLFQHNGKQVRRYEHFGPLKTDEHGKASCADVLYSTDTGNFDRWIYARISGRMVGLARSTKWTNRQAINSGGRVVMQPSCSVEGQVSVPTGFDPSKVTVRVHVMHVFTGAGMFDFESFPRHDRFPGLDRALPDLFECHPDDKGRFGFKDIPEHGRLYLVTVASGLAEAQWKNEDKTFGEPIKLTIAKEGILKGIVLSPDVKPAAGMKVTARLSSRGRIRLPHLSSFRAVTDTKGEFMIGGIPRTEFVMSIADPHERWVFRPREELLVSPDVSTELTLNLEHGVTVTGHVLDADGKPIERAAISAVADSERSPGLCDDMTDAEGRYELRLPAGSAKMYFNSLPDGFAYPRPPIIKLLDVQPGQDPIEDLNFTLLRKSDDL